MKIFIDTNILIDLAMRADQFPESLKLINEVNMCDNASLWISAFSIFNLEYILSKRVHKEKVGDFLNFIRQTFSIIPFRRSVFINALAKNTPYFSNSIQIASAEQLGMDCIITRDIENFKDCKVPVFTPVEFLEKWNTGELETFTSVPFLDLKEQYHQVYNEIDDKITDIIENTAFVLGKHVEEFEKRFADKQGARYCIGVSSGTDALHIALMALEIGPGDKVIVPVNTFIATAEAVSLCGAEPVLVDCDKYYNMDFQKLKESLKAMKHESSVLPKAIIPVHLYGQPANMDEVMAVAGEYGLNVVEDCCQAHLSRYNDKFVGNFGEFGAFSFYPGKNLGAYGEAGAIITNNKKLYEKAKMLRQHGETERYKHQIIGHNYRMEAIQGAVLSTKLKYLEEWTEKRRSNADLYNKLLGDIKEIQIPDELKNTYCVYHLYVIQAEDRDNLRKYLQGKGISTGLHYPVPIHMQKAYEFLGYKEGDFPVAEKAAKRILSLPMYPELTEGQIRYICDMIKKYYQLRRTGQE